MFMSSLSFLSLKQVLTSGAKDTLMTRSVRSGTVPVLVRLSCDEYPRLDLLACNEMKYQTNAFSLSGFYLRVYCCDSTRL